MEFSEYEGPSTVELAEVWDSLSDEQQKQIQETADFAAPTFFLSVMFGDMDTAQQTADDVIREAHRIAGIFTP